MGLYRAANRTEGASEETDGGGWKEGGMKWYVKLDGRGGLGCEGFENR